MTSPVTAPLHDECMVQKKVGRYSQVARVIKLLSILSSSKEGLSTQEIHKRLEDYFPIGRRSIYRDLEALDAAGFPVISFRNGEEVRWKLTSPHPLPKPVTIASDGPSTIEFLVNPRRHREIFVHFRRTAKLLLRADAKLHVFVNTPLNDDLIRWIIGLGTDVEVLKPAKLRQTLRETASTIAQLYSGD